MSNVQSDVSLFRSQEDNTEFCDTEFQENQIGRVSNLSQ